MRILIDCRTLYGDKQGIGFYLEKLLDALAKIDTQNEYTLCYVSGRAETDQITRLPYGNFQTKVIRLPNQAFVRVFQDSSLPYRLLRRFSRGYDVVHEPCYEPLPLARRLVLTLHDVVHLRMPDHFPASVAAAHHWRLRESTRNASQIMVDSEFTRREAMELLHVSPEKLHTVPLGVDPAAFEMTLPAEEAQRELARLGIERPFLLSIGAFGWRKNTLSALQAFARLPEELRSSHQYVIAGTHSIPQVAAQLMSEVQASGLCSSVILPGYVPEPTRRVLMNRASALLYPSLYEGFGLPPLEAMACGVPTISSDNSSIPEVVGDAGLRVGDYRDPEAWAQAITRLLTDTDLRRDLIQRGRERVQLFTWERTARETLRVYELAAQS